MRTAIIDIGSNAIRTAVYNDDTLGAAEIYNEKFKVDISSLLEQSEFNSEHDIYDIFYHFLHIFRTLKVESLTCVATEALRKHSRTPEFLLTIHQKFAINIQVLSGEEEAKLTALGLLWGIPESQGIAADLGGGSLELAEVSGHQIHQVKSLPLGTKTLSQRQMAGNDLIKQEIKQQFKIKQYNNLYLIGGAFRLIGRCYLEHNSSLMKNLHYLTIDAAEFTTFLDQISSLPKFQDFFKQDGRNKYAIEVVKALIQLFKAQQLTLSSFGLKEGLRLNLLSPEEQKKDLILERCLSVAGSFCDTLDLHSYNELYSSLTAENNTLSEKLFSAALILCQSTRHIDSQHKADSLTNFVLSTDIPFSHLQRANLTVAIVYALSEKVKNIPRSIKRMLTQEEFSHTRIAGAFIKICLLIDGPILSKPTFSLVKKGRHLEIASKHTLPKKILEQINNQLKLINAEISQNKTL